VLDHSIRLPEPLTKPVEPQSIDGPKWELSQPVIQLDVINFVVMDRAWSYAEPQYVYETQEEYLARISEEMFAAALPRMRELGVDGNIESESQLVEVVDIFRPGSEKSFSMTTIATFDMASDEAGPIATTSVMAESPPQIYATADSVYLFAAESPPWQRNGWDMAFGMWTPTTTVWKLDIDATDQSVELAAVGEFEGALLNQFSVDEHDGYLRIVTKSGGWFGNSKGQGVVIMKQSDDTLNVIGSLAGISPNEELYSIRFAGEHAFLVTFRKVDPLFVVDLGDPTNPTMLGELKVPGYSDYLQMIDDSHLLAVGRGADESTGWFEELQISIFDVSNLADPQLVDRYSFEGGRGTATEITGDRWTRGDGDHHALSYFPSEQILAIPIYDADQPIFEWSSGRPQILEVDAGRLQVLKIDVTAGFTSLGVIEHETRIRRSVEIGDRLFAISSSEVTVHELTDPTVQLGQLRIAAEPGDESIPPLAKSQPVELRWAALPIGGILPESAAIERESIAAGESLAEISANSFATEAPPAPRVVWALAALEPRGQAQPARRAAFVDFGARPPIDAQLVQLLAADMRSGETLTRGYDDEQSPYDEQEDERASDNESLRVLTLPGQSLILGSRGR
jgi:hypothetical protein